MSKTLGLNVSLYISSLAQKAKSIQIHPPYTRLPSPAPASVWCKTTLNTEGAGKGQTLILVKWGHLSYVLDTMYANF